MADNENQHYLAQMYLRAFLDPTLRAKSKDQLWVYSQGAQPESRGTKRVAAESFLYEVPGNADPNLPEKSFSRIESVSAPHLKKLRSGNINLTPQEKAEFAWFVAASMNRTPYARDLMNAAIVDTFRLDLRDMLADDALVQRLADELTAEGQLADAATVRRVGGEIARGDVPLKQRNKGTTIQHMFRGIEYWGECFRHMAWGIWEGPVGIDFITCDSPVNVNDEETTTIRFSEYKGPSRSVRFAYPLSPRLVLTGAFAKAHDQIGKVDETWVKQLNTSVIARAYKEVYASFFSDELRAEVDRIHATRRPPMPPPTLLD